MEEIKPFYLPDQLRREAERLRAKAITLDGRAEREDLKARPRSAEYAAGARSSAVRRRRLAATLEWLASMREHVADCHLCGLNACKSRNGEVS